LYPLLLLPKSEGFILERNGNALFYLCQAMHFLAAVLCIFIMPKTDSDTGNFARVWKLLKDGTPVGNFISTEVTRD
jgi:hypothetical protein